MSSLAQIQKWTQRYHFNEPEIEILLRCVDVITKELEEDSSFLSILAHSSPHALFFLPCDELENRIKICEKILPTDFEKKLKGFILSSKDRIGANSDVAENFLNGISLCCRRGPFEALKVIFDCASKELGGTIATPKDLIDLCYKLSIAAQMLAIPNADDEPICTKGDPVGCRLLRKSLLQVADENGFVDNVVFTDWALSMVPDIATTMETFVHNLIFHGQLEKERHFDRFFFPKVEDTSDFFKASDPSLLFILRCISPDLLGEWKCIYSSRLEGRSIESITQALFKFHGPTLVIIKNHVGAIFGGFATSGWKPVEGSEDSLLFQLEPFLNVTRSFDGGNNTFISHHQSGDKVPSGVGLSPDAEGEPQIFISENFDFCLARHIDKHSHGVELLEIWGIRK